VKLLFVYYAWEDQGSGNVIQGYTQAARELGHEVAVFGPPNPRIPLNYSRDITSSDAVVFIFEWSTQLQYGDHLDLVRLFGRIPRSRRVIVDGDGNYNDLLSVDGDYNHRNSESVRTWIDFCDSLADKICQPTLHPFKENVRPFLFYGYNPAWEVPLDFSSKEFSMIYVGHCKFRWVPMRKILRAIEPIRSSLRRIGFVGEGWGAQPWWAESMHMEDAYYCDYEYVRNLGIEVLSPIPFPQVIRWMSRGLLNPVIVRPTFGRMRLVTPRVFETVAANTIPLFGLDDLHVREIYGEDALGMTVNNGPAPNSLNEIAQHPAKYENIVRSLRAHLAEKHSYRARLKELIEIIET
jgi:hypothetical protein